MRITLVVHQFPPNYFTGTEQYAFGVGKELQRRGHDVDVFTLEPAFDETSGPWRESRETVEGLPVRRINFWWNIGRDWQRMEYRHPYMAEVFAKHIAERDSDVVHSFHLKYVGADLIDRVEEQRRPLVVSLMDFWFLCPRFILMEPGGSPCGCPESWEPCQDQKILEEWRSSPVAAEIEALHRASRGESQPAWALRNKVSTMLERSDYLMQRLRKADTIVAPTRFLGSVFADKGAPAERIRHLSYGVDTGHLAKEVAARRDPDRPLTFGFFGSYSPHKGPHVLVDAMAQVDGDCGVVLRGRMKDFPDFSEPLKKRADADKRIDMKGPFARDELASALAEIDVLIVPSMWHENAPFVVLEARAAGLPVLASRFGGLSEVVRDEVDGELFEAGDSADLARRLQRLIEEPDRLARYRAAVEPPKTLQTAVDEFEAVYGDACQRKRRPL